jgi:hypothetical protein
LLAALYLLDFIDWTYVNDDPLAEVMVMRYRMEVVLPGVLKTTKYYALFDTNFVSVQPAISTVFRMAGFSTEHPQYSGGGGGGTSIYPYWVVCFDILIHILKDAQFFVISFNQLCIVCTPSPFCKKARSTTWYRGRKKTKREVS